MATMYARSFETEEHARRIAYISKIIGECMNLSQKGLDELQLFSMLHDIGKIGITDSVLNKPGDLSEEEWSIMKKHPEIGFKIAMSSPGVRNGCRIHIVSS
jgi:HD-GYP domain-containing protein (c-di-GMP phosphodiesterase class II)